MKKLFLIILLLVISNISYSQFRIGQSITLKDSSGYLVINAPIKTNTSIDWLSPKNLDSSIAGSGLSLSTSSGLIVNVGKGLQITNDTIITDNSLLFSLDTTKLGYLAKGQVWTGNNTFTSSNVFYGNTYFGNIETDRISATNDISVNGSVDITGTYKVNGVALSIVTVDTSLLMHKTGTQSITAHTTFTNDLTLSGGTILNASQINADLLEMGTGIINSGDVYITGELHVTNTSDSVMIHIDNVSAYGLKSSDGTDNIPSSAGYYGLGFTNFLTEPNVWIRVEYNNADYIIPLYTYTP